MSAVHGILLFSGAWAKPPCLLQMTGGVAVDLHQVFMDFFACLHGKRVKELPFRDQYVLEADPKGDVLLIQSSQACLVGAEIRTLVLPCMLRIHKGCDVEIITEEFHLEIHRYVPY